jgi:ribosomal protein S6
MGIGLDNEDGHKRLTQAEKFSIVGGSEETHEKMTETLIKTFEDLKTKGKELEETGKEELAEIINRHTPG